MTAQIGTPAFMAPEMISGGDSEGELGVRPEHYRSLSVQRENVHKGVVFPP